MTGPLNDPQSARRIGGMWKTLGIWLASLALAAAGLLEKPHPRLWFPAGTEDSVRNTFATDPLAAQLQAAAMAEAEKVLKARTCRYEIPDGKRLLGESRRAIHNVMHSAWAWRITGEEKFRLRTIAELEAACALKDWNPSHFLDTAEMATAVATGYDWLHATLTPAQRTMCEKAIVEKALKPAKGVYDKKGWWAKPGNNWSQVCGSGIALAAAAIAGHDEGLSEELFSKGLELVESCGEFYQPDGNYPEGPSYWQYGTTYHVILLAACPGLGVVAPNDPILRDAGASLMHLTGPTRLPFNFADGNASRSTPSSAQCWLARHFKDATQVQYVRHLYARALKEDRGRVSGDRFSPLAVLWLPAAVKDGKTPVLAAAYRGEQAVAAFRTGWDADAAWLSVKGGTPAASHGHMDAGAFVYDAHGTRWFHDLGSENYNFPGYFGSKRWTYYRLQNRSHNTLEIAGNLQNPKAKPCPLVDAKVTGNPLEASFDLTDAYAGSAGKVIRKARFDTRSGIARIEDRISAPVGTVVWRAFTDADPEIDGADVILRKKGKQITLRRISDAGTWSIADAKPPTSAEQQNKAIKAVVLTVPKAAAVSVDVEIRP